MSTRFTHALLRRPGRSYSQGITASDEGAPDFDTALAQHAAYEAALRDCGLQTQTLAADEACPDGCFVEDTALICAGAAIITQPGAPSRSAETEAVAAALGDRVAARMSGDARLDAGDVCETDDLVIIGLSHRTNAEGAAQLGAFLADLGVRSAVVDIRPIAGLLHLKTGISYLGQGRMALAPFVPAWPELARFEPVRLAAPEAYAANALAVNDRLLIPAGYPRFAETLDRLGYDLLPLEMSEFRKMDGGLSCLSLRWQA